jgi:hypothetical protein
MITRLLFAFDVWFDARTQTREERQRAVLAFSHNRHWWSDPVDLSQAYEHKKLWRSIILPLKAMVNELLYKNRFIEEGANIIEAYLDELPSEDNTNPIYVGYEDLDAILISKW